MMARLLPALLFATILGCAGTHFKWSDARQVQAGMTTKEVSALLGAPTSVRSAGETLIYVWVWINPYGQSKTLTVPFKDGKVVSQPAIPDEFQD